ncbi:unnamed protein product [Fraxinus pennsylvanica]|uniref:Uncharacterized protein n=1 Tax=Fraxinus pennsylvanica TaxID=56036 RepID=A0AAD2DPJ2_9LAMI|nr:unnamed protein product [Fraxinus pennsylvanica]
MWVPAVRQLVQNYGCNGQKMDEKQLKIRGRHPLKIDVVSPRISFSYDLREADFVPVDSHNPQSDLDFIDFDFSIGDHFSLELSSADELFANGKIFPVEVKKFEPSKEIYRSEPIEPSLSTRTRKFVQNANEDTVTKKKTLIEFLSNTCDAEEKPPT